MHRFLQQVAYLCGLAAAVWYIVHQTQSMLDTTKPDQYIKHLQDNSHYYKEGMERMTNMSSQEFIRLRQAELSRRENLWFLFAKKHNVDLALIAKKVQQTLSPFSKGIVRNQVVKACSLEESEAICFFLINGTLMSHDPKTPALKEAAKDFANLIYQTQTAFGDTLPNMMLVYNVMDTPRIIPGRIPNNTMNATIGVEPYYDMVKALCKNIEVRYKDQHAHLAVPYKSFVIHDLAPMFSASVINNCSMDIHFPHHSFVRWLDVYPKLLKRHDKIPWSEKKAVAFWRGNLTGGFINQNTLRYMPRFFIAMQNRSDFDFAITHSPLSGKKYNETKGKMKYDSWRYKYVMDLDSNGASEDMATLLASGSAIMKHDPLYQEFYYDWMIPNAHFAPIFGDFRNLNDTVELLKERDDIAEKFAKESFEFFKHKLKPAAVYAYIYNLLTSYWWLHLFEYIPQPCEKCVTYNNDFKTVNI